MKRAQNKVRRILMLIDALAPLRMPFTMQDAIDRLAERTGSKVQVCNRTIRRDFELLISMNFIYIYKKGTPASRFAACEPALYRMNLTASSITNASNKI